MTSRYDYDYYTDRDDTGASDEGYDRYGNNSVDDRINDKWSR